VFEERFKPPPVGAEVAVVASLDLEARRQIVQGVFKISVPVVFGHTFEQAVDVVSKKNHCCSFRVYTELYYR
jgi:hypothetical protein